MTRSIDHCVLPTADLAVARARLAALGFTVAPNGVHPFGTGNACVYFSDATFLEPLAVADATQARQAVSAGNVFVAHDAGFRRRRGEEGFSALVFATADADGDHAGFEQARVSAGRRLDFSRPFADASGRADTASFRLAFAGDGDSPEALFFTCERVNAPKVDRTALERHDNGVTGIAEVVLTANRPADHVAFLETVTGAPARQRGAGFEVRLPNALLSLTGPGEFAETFGVPPAGGDGLLLGAIAFSVDDLAPLRRRLGPASVERGAPSRVVAPPAPGQGAVFAFGSE